MSQVNNLKLGCNGDFKSFLKELSILRTSTKVIMNTKQILYYTDLICEKIDLRADTFIKRIEALSKGDMEQVEFIEKMMLEPLDKQIVYLVSKATSLGKKEKRNGQ